ncbi:MAG TPA: hypothetical protein PLK37_13970 [Terricaulis sp.]|nr:hypothetical protein [Terricaulis sp.]
MKQAGAWIAIFSSLALASCDAVQLGPQGAASAPPAPAAAAAPAPDLRGLAGVDYLDFTARPEFTRYSAEGLGLSTADQARLMAAMSGSPRPSWIADGGGARALLFTGCAAEGCASGRGVVAIDLATGAAFAGVRDSAGRTELAPNPRLEALLRLSSPERTWDTPEPPAASAERRP